MLRTVFAIEVAVLYAVILPGVSHVRHLDVVGYRVQFTNNFILILDSCLLYIYVSYYNGRYR